MVRNFQQRKKNKILHSFPVIFVLFLVCILFGMGVFTLFHKMQNTEKNKDVAKEKFRALEERKEKLSIDILNLSNDKGKEKVFREDYGYAKEGEGVIVIVDDKDIVPQNTPINKGFFDRILDFFSL